MYNGDGRLDLAFIEVAGGAHADQAAAGPTFVDVGK
jgi:hypothetical protein